MQFHYSISGRYLFILFHYSFLSDACIISEENMKKNNIQLKWRDSRKLYAKTGDIVEFMCKDSRKAAQHTPAFRAVCHEGKFEYPKCE